jgi:UDP-N-acetylglucosamine--N-acetylmuramyl-(pentapeptide) pyrophosphoryl-undecaprenol N-acetylglucosamine transferase
MTTPPSDANAPRILLAGGGSAGHVSPLLATAAALQARRPGTEVLVLGTESGLEADLVRAAGFELLTIDKVPFPRRPDGAALRFPRDFHRAVRDVTRILTDRGILAVGGFGGYVCPPAYRAAAKADIPRVIHEANLVPGLANRLGARGAAAVLTAFPDTPLPHARRVGMPMRAGIAKLDRPATHDQAARALGLDPTRPVLLVTGGSLGAQHLNEVVVQAAPRLLTAGVQILHVTGKGKTEVGASLADQADYHLVEYVTAMEDAYASADLAITRSGAGTVSELSAVGLPALLVPLPIGNGEQARNGRPLVDAGGALMIADDDLEADALANQVLDLLADADAMETMSSAALGFGVRDAAEQVARVILDQVPTSPGLP